MCLHKIFYTLSKKAKEPSNCLSLVCRLTFRSPILTLCNFHNIKLRLGDYSSTGSSCWALVPHELLIIVCRFYFVMSSHSLMYSWKLLMGLLLIVNLFYFFVFLTLQLLILILSIPCLYSLIPF